jgi:hypothetical protein
MKQGVKMKTLKTLSFCFIVLAISQGSIIKADDLFAGSGNQNVFKNVQQSSPTTQAAGNQISNSDLAQFVNAMGYTVKDLGDNVYAINIKKGKWTFEPVISIRKGGTRIWVQMNLKTYQSKNALTADQYMKLLDANLTYGPVVFNFDMKKYRISVSRSFKNENLMPGNLKNYIIDMCKVAEETESLWYIEKTSTFPSPQQTTPAPRQTKKPNQPYWLKNVSIENNPVEKKQVSQEVGQWKSNENTGQVFELIFRADGTYVLKATKGTEKDRDDGTYTIINNLLILTGNNGDVLKGWMKWNSDGTFNFVTFDAPSNATGIQFSKRI